MSFLPPTLAQFQAQFPRDWQYGSGPETVTPNDIQNAINEAYPLFNPNLFDSSIPSFSTIINGDITAGSTTIINLSSMTGLSPNQSIAGVGIPVSTIISFVGLTSIIISLAATETLVGDQLSIGGTSGISVSEAQIAYCYLAAHLMVLSLQAAGGLGVPLGYQGAGSSGGGIVNSKTVGSVSLSYTLPDFVMKSPTLSQYMRTAYGQKYIQMVAPKIPGRRVMVVGGEPTVGNPLSPFPVGGTVP